MGATKRTWRTKLVPASRWPDDGVVLCVLWYFVSGLILLILDSVSWLRTGSFAVASSISLPVGRVLYAVGLVASIVCVAGRPSRLVLIILALACTAVYGWATFVLCKPILSS